MSQIRAIALSAFSQMATYLREGLTDIAVIPSDPSIPNKKKVKTIMNRTSNVDLCLLIDIVDNDVVT